MQQQQINLPFGVFVSAVDEKKCSKSQFSFEDVMLFTFALLCVPCNTTLCNNTAICSNGIHFPLLLIMSYSVILCSVLLYLFGIVKRFDMKIQAIGSINFIFNCYLSANMQIMLCLCSIHRDSSIDLHPIITLSCNAAASSAIRSAHLGK